MSKMKVNELAPYSNPGIGIGAPTTDASALLNLQSTTQGVLLPRMTAAQRDAIVTPATGLLIYNTDTGFFEQYNGSSWGQISSSNFVPLSYLGAANGVPTLDSGRKIPIAQLPSSLMEYQGTWDASTNTPTLADGTGTSGFFYRINVAGTQNLGSGSQTFVIGDWVMYNGSIWQLAHAGADAVISVNGSSGVVTINAINQLTGDASTSVASGSQALAVTVNKAASGAVLFSAAPSGGAVLDIQSTAGGLGLPVLTSAQRDALTPARNGVTIWNSDNTRMEIFGGSSWNAAGGVTAHSALSGLTTGDDHTQYPLLAGRTGGQTLIGGTASTDFIIIKGTSAAIPTTASVYIGGGPSSGIVAFRGPQIIAAGGTPTNGSTSLELQGDRAAMVLNPNTTTIRNALSALAGMLHYNTTNTRIEWYNGSWVGPVIADGFAGGQTINGGTAASDNLTLTSTSNVTKGKILFGTTAAFDELHGTWGIGTQSPSTSIALDARPPADSSAGSLRMNSANGVNQVDMGVSNAGAFRMINWMSGGHTIMMVTGSQDCFTWGSGGQNAFMAMKPGAATPTTFYTATFEAGSSQTQDITGWFNTSGVKCLSVTTTGVINTVAANEATGSGSAALGANSPATTNTAPYTWIKFKSSDGSTVYVPAWK